MELTILPLLCKHSPDGITRAKQRTSNYSSLLIYRPRKDDRLRWLFGYRNDADLFGRTLIPQTVPVSGNKRWSLLVVNLSLAALVFKISSEKKKQTDIYG